MDYRLPQQLSNVGSGRVALTWTYPPAIKDNVVGARILYTDQNGEHVERWQRVDIHNAQQRAAVLMGLRANTNYHVQIVPLLYDGEPAFQWAEKLRIRAEAPSAEA